MSRPIHNMEIWIFNCFHSVNKLRQGFIVNAVNNVCGYTELIFDQLLSGYNGHYIYQLTLLIQFEQDLTIAASSMPVSSTNQMLQLKL